MSTRCTTDGEKGRSSAKGEGRRARKAYPERPSLRAEDLSGLAGPWMDVFPDRCVVLRNRNAQCTRCVDACPTGSLYVRAGGVRVDPGLCTGCGACATACPTCALESRGPSDAELRREVRDALEAQGADAVVVCDPAWRRAGDSFARDRAVRVPCLARVDESVLLDAVANGARRVLMVHGACDRCPGSRALPVVEQVVRSARHALAAWGSAATVELREKIPPCVTDSGASAASRDLQRGGSAPIGARGESVWGRQAPAGGGDAARQLPVPGDGWRPPTVMSDGTMPHFLPDRRELILNSLARLGEPAEGARLAGRAWATVEVDPGGCSTCTMCATFCPTGALSKVCGEHGEVRLEHRPADCVACSSCQDVCPTGALRLVPGADAGAVARGEAPVSFDLPPVRDDRGGAHSMIGALRKVMRFEYVYER